MARRRSPVRRVFMFGGLRHGANLGPSLKLSTSASLRPGSSTRWSWGRLERRHWHMNVAGDVIEGDHQLQVFSTSMPGLLQRVLHALELERFGPIIGPHIRADQVQIS